MDETTHQHSEVETVEARRNTILSRLRFAPKLTWFFLLASIVINMATWGYILWKLPPSNGTVFLHYTIYYGVDLTGEWWRLLLMPGTGLLVILLHSIPPLSKKRESIVTTTSYALALVFQILLAIATFLIISVNESL
jgi:hypothetical protein